MTKFVLDYSTWRSGGEEYDDSDNVVGKGDTELLNEEGYMCCLGQLCLQLGLVEEDIRDYTSPGTVAKYKEHTTEKLIPLLATSHRIDTNSAFSLRAMEINDNSEFTIGKRIAHLKKLFVENGIEMEVINMPESLEIPVI